MKATLLSLAAIALLLSGCVNVKHATIQDSELNVAGWKSQAASGGEKQAIEATTTPNTTATLPLQ